MLASPLFTSRWRWDATRALALLRFSSGKKVPSQIQRMRAEDLLAAVFPDAAACQDNIVGEMRIPDHPLINEVMKDVLTEAMDIDGLVRVLENILDGRIECIAVDTTQPSVFAHEILNANPYAYLDDAPLEERRARAVEMRRVLPDNIVQEYGRLDPEAIASVTAGAAPDIRDADELYDVLLSLIVFPEEFLWPNALTSARGDLLTTPAVGLWKECFQELISTGRARRVAGEEGRAYWVAAEVERAFAELVSGYSDCGKEPNGESGASPVAQRAFASREEMLDQAIYGWLMHSGPLTATSLSRATALPREEIERTFLRLESRGSILRGNFTGEPDAVEWCERGLLARIHRLTQGALRKLIEPVTTAEFMDWLFDWQHVGPGSQLIGEHGTAEVVRQLQGVEAPANAWESRILPSRVWKYQSDFLDKLCLTGVVGWARLSPHPAVLGNGGAGAALAQDLLVNVDADEPPGPAVGIFKSGIRRVVPTSVSPIGFYVREDMDWVRRRRFSVNTDALSTAARLVFESLKTGGASFFLDIVRDCGILKAEVETALWELVTAGLVTADGFDNLRALINPRRRSGNSSRYGGPMRARHGQGRWSLITVSGSTDSDTAVEAACWMLLRRYGVVFREVLARETCIPRWRELLMMLRRLEAQGKIRGGRFVSGFMGEQFAGALAVESLRARRARTALTRTVRISAADPLHLVGIIVPGLRIAANSSREILFKDGAFVESIDL